VVGSSMPSACKVEQQPMLSLTKEQPQSSRQQLYCMPTASMATNCCCCRSATAAFLTAYNPAYPAVHSPA
jgi:hypothetical protein